MRGDPEKSGVSVWYLLARRRGSALCLPEGSKSGGAIRGKLKGFHLLPECRAREGLGFQAFDSCWPRGSEGFVRPSHTLSRGDPADAWSFPFAAPGRASAFNTKTP